MLHLPLISRPVAGTCLIMTTALLCCIAFESWFLTTAGTLLILQLGAVVVSFFYTRWYAIAAAAVCAVSFNYFFTNPRYSLAMHNVDDIVNMLLLFGIAILSSQFASYYRGQQQAFTRSRLLARILMSVSHDLRTPLSTVIGSLDTLKKYRQKLGAAEQNELINGALEETNRLHRYIENLLQTVKLQQTGTLERSAEVSPSDLLRGVMRRFHCSSIQLSLPDTDTATIRCSEQLLSQAFYNVIDNALIFSPPGAQVYVSFIHEGSNITFTIRDFGPGMSKDMLTRCFDSFVSIRQTDSGKGGSGIGLTVAKGIIEAHGGTITIQNSQPGCTVSIALSH